MSFSVPFHASTVVSLARGKSQDVEFDKMRLKARRWLLIDEIKFAVNPKDQSTDLISTLIGNSSSDVTGNDWGAIILATIKCGRNYLAEQVPLWLFGSRWNLRSELSTQRLVKTTGTGIAWANLNHITWKFLHPMLVPPDTVVGFNLQRPSTSTLLDPAAAVPNAIEVEVSISGEQLLSPPPADQRVSRVPYVQAFVVPDSLAQDYAESGEFPLKNAFQQPLSVERLVARAAASGASGGSIPGPIDLLCFTSYTLAGNKPGKNILQIQVQDDQHYDIANQPAYKWQSIYNPTYQFYDAIWQAQNSSLVTPFELQPKGWLNVRFHRTDGLLWNDDHFPISPMFAMIGSRKERL